MRRPGFKVLAISAIPVVLAAWLLTSTLRGSWRGSHDGDPPAAGTGGEGLPELAGTQIERETTASSAILQATPSWAITGHVLGAEGGPLPEARVRAISRRGQVRHELPSVRTDAAGAYRLDLTSLAREAAPVRATVILTVFAEAEGYLPSDEVEYFLSLVRPGTPIALDLQVGQVGMGVTVKGRVVDEAGTPLSAASVGILSLGDGGGEHFYTRTGPDGRFTGPAWLLGPHVVKAEWCGIEARTERFDVRGGAEVIAPDLVMPGTAALIEGIVLRPDGTPGPNLAVLLREEEPDGYDWGRAVAVSDEAGRFRFAAAAGVTWRVGVETRFPRDPIQCRAGGPPIRLTIPACRLVIRVMTENGTPLPGAWVDLMAWRTGDRAARDALVAGKTTRQEAAWHTRPWERIEIPSGDGTDTSYVDPDTVWFFSARVPGGVPTEGTLGIPCQVFSYGPCDHACPSRDLSPIDFVRIRAAARPLVDSAQKQQTPRYSSWHGIRSCQRVVYAINPN